MKVKEGDKAESAQRNGNPFPLGRLSGAFTQFLSEESLENSSLCTKLRRGRHPLGSVVAIDPV